MATTSCSTIEEYYELLRVDVTEQAGLAKDLSVNVSWLFREPLTWYLFKTQILKKLLENKYSSDESVLRIWSAGCAAGEEAYTAAILILELLRSLESKCTFQIIATDIDERSLDKARQGLYQSDSLRNMPFGMLTKYFENTDEGFLINPEVRKMVSFSHFDLLTTKHSAPPDAVFGSFEVVICQNVLIYYTRPAQDRILNKVFKAIVPEGYLILGSSEHPLPSQQRMFQTVFKEAQIYRKI